MNKQIQINRETKIMLLKVLKNGYFEMSDFENFLILMHSGLSDEDVRELYKKTDIREPVKFTLKI